MKSSPSDSALNPLVAFARDWACIIRKIKKIRCVYDIQRHYHIIPELEPVVTSDDE